MFAPKFDANKLKTNLRICATRLKSLYQKRNELNIRSRRELSDYLRNKKVDRARIRVEHIVREDYLLEVFEIVELYCELLITRLGLITSTRECDEGLKEAIATIIWVAPRLSHDCPELEVLKTLFTTKYGHEFVQACATNSNHSVNAKVMNKLNVKAPPANLCEAYLVEIARSYDVEFTPDPHLLNNVDQLLDLGEPPELPSYGMSPQELIKFDSSVTGPGAPYPEKDDKSLSNLPNIPPENGPGIKDVGEPSPPPPYLNMDHSPDKKSSGSGENGDKKSPPPYPNKDNSPGKKNSVGSENGGKKSPPPPADDDDDLDALTARFNRLRKDP